jgi:hypothetical protein
MTKHRGDRDVGYAEEVMMMQMIWMGWTRWLGWNEGNF